MSRTCIATGLLLASLAMGKLCGREVPDEPETGKPLVVEPMLAAGDDHTCHLSGHGRVKCWGGNWSGKLGDGTQEDRTSPVEVTVLGEAATAIAAGDYHTCAITASGTVRCWGSNENGQLGKLDGLGAPVTLLTAAGSHTCALPASGQVTCWGDNTYGQLGDGTNSSRPEPRKAGNLALAVAGIAAGKSHTCAFNTNGTAHCWGMNMAGELGIGSTKSMSSSDSVFTDKGEEISGIFPGDGRTCAVLKTGEGLCWGSSMYGLTGDGRAVKESNAPVRVKWIGKNAASFALGRDHTCALLKDGTIRCWGMIGEDQNTKAVEVEGLDGVVRIAAGSFHTCALLGSGSVKCWGSNGSGQLGDGTTTDRKTPVNVKGL